MHQKHPVSILIKIKSGSSKNLETKTENRWKSTFENEVLIVDLGLVVELHTMISFRSIDKKQAQDTANNHYQKAEDRGTINIDITVPLLPYHCHFNVC